MPARGEHHSDETKHKIGQAHQGLWSDDRRQSQAEALAARWKDPEFRAKVAEGRRKGAEERARRISANQPDVSRYFSPSHQRDLDELI